MKKAFIISARRSPTGRLLGCLSGMTAPELAGQVIKDALGKTGMDPSLVDEVVMGNVLSTGIGQNPARQAALLAGLPKGINAFSVNKVCASGLKAVALGSQAIIAGEADFIIAGGMESMSNAPFLSKEMRRGRRLGNAELMDSVMRDGLMDCYFNKHMGELCELTVRKERISRRAEDEFAFLSHKKAKEASKRGFFKDEIAPVVVGGRIIEDDETIRWNTSIKKLTALNPVFKEGGTITPGNSPGINDGAAVLALASDGFSARHGLKPIGEVVAWSSAHIEPEWYTLAPVYSVKKLLEKTGLKLRDFDLIEENEAFAAQTLAVIKALRLDVKKVNVNGGAIALGHPIGASGARILVTLLHALRNRKKELGLATLCLGGGGAMSMAIRAYR